MPHDDVDLKETGETLHRRLLKEKDQNITTEISERFLPLLIVALRRRFPSLYDPHLIEIVAIDALFEYFKQPEKFDPNKGALVGYLYLIAYRDLLNLLEKQRKYVALDAQVIESMDSPGRRDNPESRLIEETSPLVQKTRMVVSDPVDQQVLALMMDGVRETSDYVEVLGIEDHSIAEQARLVKGAKDRVRKTILRKVAYRRALVFMLVWTTAARQWAKAATRKTAPIVVQLIALAVLVGVNAYLWQKARATPAAPRSVSPSAGATRKAQETVTVNGMKGRWVEKIFFASNRDSANKDQMHIWRMNPDGTQTEQVTFGDWSDRIARVSPDGTKLAFQRSISASSADKTGKSSIWIKDLLIGTEQAITETTDYPAGIYHSGAPTWSPDGTKIAFVRSVAREGDTNDEPFARLWIVEVSPAIGIPKPLSSEQGLHHNAPDWSPDGRHILFMRHLTHDAVVALYSIDVETGKEEEVIPCEGDEYEPRYSPDGSKIIWTTFRHTNTSDVWTDVYVADSLNPGNSQYRLSPNSGWGTADWSPDGSQVALTSERTKLTQATLTAIRNSYEGQIPGYIIDELKPLVGREFLTPGDYEAALRELSGEVTSKRYRYKFPSGFLRSDDLWIAEADGSNFKQLVSTEWIEYVLDWTLAFQPDADLAISAQVSRQQAAPGDKITFTVTVTNNEAGAAKNVVVTNEISPEAKTLSISSTGNSTTGSTSNQGAITFPTLAPHQSETITIVVRIKRSASDGAVITNVVTANLANFDANQENNSVTITLMVSSR